MKHISVKMTDADYNRLAEERGDKSISDYVRTIIFSRRKEAEKELGAFQKLINDVSFMKESLNTLSKNITTRNDLLSLALFIVEVLSVANPSVYANQKDKLQDIYNKLKGDVENER
jgi:predicted CopG family antitoxin